MFESSAPFALFDYFRVPYERAPRLAAGDPGAETVAARGQEARLMWPTQASLGSEGRRAGPHFLGSIPIFGRILGDAQMRALMRRCGGAWTSTDVVRDKRTSTVSAVWRRDDGSAFLPFDPNELISNFWTERYLDLLRPAVSARINSLARRGYYPLRPLLPRSLQLSLRRSYRHVQSKSRFPRWPVEAALHDLYRLLFDLVVGVAGRPVPHIAAWPGAWSWALVLTHDVEGNVGYTNLRRLLQVELDAGYRSSWNFVPRNGYDVESGLVDDLRSDGFEVGVHGLYHDGRDLSSPAVLRRRLPLIREYAERWQAKGFRSPATLRSATLMP